MIWRLDQTWKMGFEVPQCLNSWPVIYQISWLLLYLTARSVGIEFQFPDQKDKYSDSSKTLSKSWGIHKGIIICYVS